MARPLRVHPPGGFHHVTARGNDRQPIFVDDVDRQSFLSLLASVRERFGCELHAYCLMSNHVHLVVQDHSGSISKSLRHIKGVHAQRFNRRHGRVGHLFEGRFWNALLGDDSYLVNAVEYVHHNPVAAGMTDHPGDYAWSSYRAYAGQSPPATALRLDKVLQLYGSRRALVDAAHPTEDMTQRFADFEMKRQRPVIGDKAFVSSMLSSVQASPETKASADRALSQRDRRDIGCLVHLVAGQFAVDASEVLASRRGRRNLPRMVVAEVARREGWPLSDIADELGFSSPGAASVACSRLTNRLDDDIVLAAVIDGLAADAEAKGVVVGT